MFSEVIIYMNAYQSRKVLLVRPVIEAEKVLRLHEGWFFKQATRLVNKSRLLRQNGYSAHENPTVFVHPFYRNTEVFSSGDFVGTLSRCEDPYLNRVRSFVQNNASPIIVLEDEGRVERTGKVLEHMGDKGHVEIYPTLIDDCHYPAVGWRSVLRRVRSMSPAVNLAGGNLWEDDTGCLGMTARKFMDNGFRVSYVEGMTFE